MSAAPRPRPKLTATSIRRHTTQTVLDRLGLAAAANRPSKFFSPYEAPSVTVTLMIHKFGTRLSLITPP